MNSLILDDHRRRLLATAWGIALFRYHPETDSTQDTAKSLTDSGSPEWTLVVAGHQTSGRGRHGRAWLSAPGVSLLLSIIMRPRNHGALSLLPIRVGIAVAGAIDALLGVDEKDPPRAKLKWPNDVMMDGGKLGGVLCEGYVQADASVAVVGVGLNIFPFNYDPDGISQAHPAFLADGMPRGVTRLTVLEHVVKAIRHTVNLSSEILSGDEQAVYAKRDWLRDKVLRDPPGKVAGINEYGHLLVKQEGRLHEVMTGSILLR